MNNKIIGILIVTLLISTAVLSVAGNINIEKEQELVQPVESNNLLKSSSPRPLQLPTWLLKLVNPDWNTWDYPPNMFADTVGNVGIGCLIPPYKFSVFTDVWDYGAYINNNKGTGLFVGSAQGVAIVANSSGSGSWAVEANCNNIGVRAEGGFTGLVGLNIPGGGEGVRGWSPDGTGVYGWSTSGTGILAESDTGYALTVNDVMKLNPRPDFPSGASDGDLIVKGSTGNYHIYCYLNGGWRQLD